MKTGILLVNLGSPKTATVQGVREYLREFLMDSYVLQMPWLQRALLVYGIILPLRPKKTLANYLKIWTPEGSPLIVESIKLKEKLQKQFPDTQVEIAMRYAEPSIQNALSKFRSQKIQNVKVVPLYPQYALSTTRTTEKRLEELNTDNFFKFKILKDFFNDAGFIDSLAAVAHANLANNPADHLLISFHGLPKSHLGQKVQSPTCDFKDCCNKLTEKNRYCYRAQCFETARLLANKIGYAQKYSVSFQSRLTGGWIEPFTDDIIQDMPKKGIKNLAIICPSFVADCLETLEEVNKGERQRFLQAGGESFTYIPCVNDSDEWIEALKQILSSL